MQTTRDQPRLSHQCRELLMHQSPCMEHQLLKMSRNIVSSTPLTAMINLELGLRFRGPIEIINT